MPNALLLDSFHVRGFRAFRDLTVERLGRVNLITGKNNVGKSCLLEALWVYANRGAPSIMMSLLESRDELAQTAKRNGTADQEQTLQNLRFLFHGRSNIQEQSEPITMGPVGRSDDTLTILAGWAIWVMQVALTVGEIAEQRVLRMVRQDEYQSAENPILVFARRYGKQAQDILPIERSVRIPSSFATSVPITGTLVPASGLGASRLAPMWDAIALSPLEDDVLRALRIIAPAVERITFVAGGRASRERIPVVRLAGEESPIPLRSLGEGMNRLFGVALAMVSAKNGLLLIDEIDSGLHYAVQPDLWRMILVVAAQLNIQVFATTHSWDCISAFQRATAQNIGSEGMLIRLSERDGVITPTLFDESRLAIAAREQIEVR